MPSDPLLPAVFSGCAGFLFDYVYGVIHILSHCSFPIFCFSHTLFSSFFFLFLVNANSSSSSGCRVCVGLMYLFICSHSSPLLYLFFNCKEQDSLVMYLNWMLTAAENVSSLFINPQKIIMTLLLLLSMLVGI